MICQQLNCGIEGASAVPATKYANKLEKLLNTEFINHACMCMHSISNIDVFRGFG